MKRCGTCAEHKEDAEFHRDRSSPDGLQHKCKPCQREAQKRWRQNHRDEHRSYVSRYHRENTDTRMDNYLRNTYGITKDEFDRMLEEQDGVCAICRRAEKDGKRLCVDHCHATGRVRGLLCGLCNGAIGMARDDPDILVAAAVYLAQGLVDAA